MPELPEVETVRRGLEPIMTGATIALCEIFDSRLVQPFDPTAIAANISGTRVVEVGRRGKYLLIQLSNGMTAMHHLRMTGSFRTISPATASDDLPPTAHLRMLYRIDGGGVVHYYDPRRFGTLNLLPTDGLDEYLATRLGPEPFDGECTGDYLFDRLQRKSVAVKAALLDQRIVAGLGNIYVDEVCWMSRIAPSRPSNMVTRADCGALVANSIERLEEAILLGGSTLRDYRAVAGEVGGMQEQFFAYGRSGEACFRCGSVMSAGRVAGRGTTWCATCQK